MPAPRLEDGGPRESANRLRGRLIAAESAAGVALSDLGASTGNPLSAVASVIEDCWTAEGSPTRSNFVADVRGAGAGVRDSFSGAKDDLGAQFGREHTPIDIDAHPDQEWKTNDWGIDSRVNAPYRGGNRW